MLKTGITFQTDDDLVQRLYDSAEKKLTGNIRDFCGRRVLIEGGGYNKLWLETQPMGGEMYAKRDMEAALNNQLLFMENQREDGRLPGSIAVIDGRLVPQFNKLQGFCFPAPALNMYYWAGGALGEGPSGSYYNDYLRQLYECLEKFDAYLWRVRDSDGDGCLESWCVYDTGEDNALRYGNAPSWYEDETPPQGYAVVPMASMDFMSFSYSARDTLARIAEITGSDTASYWRGQAGLVRNALRGRLWSEERAACFDRDRLGNSMPTLTHNNLRCMYWGSFSQDMADKFVREHLTNTREFWTPVPLPSVAANDPLFRNNPGNDWSGQPQGLTYQRAIHALESYGYHDLVTALGRKLFEAVGDDCVFAQQYDTFGARRYTGEQADKPADCYGPTMLAVLEYISRIYGVHLEGRELWWGARGTGSSEYVLQWGNREYRLLADGTRVEGRINGRVVFTAAAGTRIVTDYVGNVIRSA